MNYISNSTEEYVNKMYKSIDIYHPHQLSLEDVAARNGLSVVYSDAHPMSFGNAILLNTNNTYEQQWQAFGHELCHALWHAGGQIAMPMSWEVYQEAKANNFAQYACIPTFMLLNMKLPRYEQEAVWMIMETFNVERDFAEKRLHQFLRNLYNR